MRNIELSPELVARGKQLWDELVPQHLHGPLPFVEIDPNNPGEIISFWTVTESGDEFDDLARGYFYAELLVHRAKTVRGNFDPFQMIWAVMIAVSEKRDLGMIERGFLGRIAQLAQVASLN
jgi:hypothetical protein